LYQESGNKETIQRQHRKIFEEIRNHAPEAASLAMETHIRFVQEFFKKIGK
jgi:DNA-binding FadR family transcriptional regulator